MDDCDKDYEDDDQAVWKKNKTKKKTKKTQLVAGFSSRTDSAELCFLVQQILMIALNRKVRLTFVISGN